MEVTMSDKSQVAELTAEDQLDQTKLDQTKLDRVYDVLVAMLGVQDSWREDFVMRMSTGTNEYRIQGKLGFGGKYWADGKVTCYSEDETSELTALIDATNIAIKDILALSHTKPVFHPFLAVTDVPAVNSRVWTKHGLGIVVNGLHVLHSNGVQCEISPEDMWVEKPVRYVVKASWPGCRFSVGDVLETYPGIKGDYAHGDGMPPINSVQKLIDETIGRAWVVDPHLYPEILQRQ
jgi:hypothetical protein